VAVGPKMRRWSCEGTRSVARCTGRIPMPVPPEEKEKIDATDKPEYQPLEREAQQAQANPTIRQNARSILTAYALIQIKWQHGCHRSHAKRSTRQHTRATRRCLVRPATPDETRPPPFYAILIAIATMMPAASYLLLSFHCCHY